MTCHGAKNNIVCQSALCLYMRFLDAIIAVILRNCYSEKVVQFMFVIHSFLNNSVI